MPGSGKPQYVVLLVHGTFAPDAEWTHDGSPLRVAIEDGLGGAQNVEFDVFVWTGLLGTRFNNGHAYRLNAARKLRSRIEKLRDRNPDARHVIVAHSHGGNVALYSLKEINDEAVISGVACMATPYFTCRPRDVGKFTDVVIGIWALAVFVSLKLPFQYFISHKTTFPSVGGILWMSCLGVAAEAVIIVAGSLVGWLLSTVIAAASGLLQKRIVARLSADYDARVPLLSLRVAGDEPTAALSALRRLTEVPISLWSREGYCCAGCLAAFISSAVVFGTIIRSQIRHSSGSVSEMYGLYFEGNMRVLLWVLIVLAVGVAHLLLAAMLGRLRSHQFAFGWETALDWLLVDVGVDRIPSGFKPAGQNREIEYELAPGGLRHSRIYTHPVTLEDLVCWIRGLGGG